MRRPVITLLTDFGGVDHYVGAMKGVMLGIAPDAQLVDLTHEISVFGIAEAAYTLAQAWRCFPAGTVHAVVVDPGVGSARRPIAAGFGGHYFVAPDNGVLTMALEVPEDARVHEITASQMFRQPVSRTFHGRDIFAPVAAHLAVGVALADLGPRIEAYERLEPASGEGRVLKVDRFGNLVTNFKSDEWLRRLSGGFKMRVGRAVVSRVAVNYADAGEGLFVIAGSAGFLEISARQASAARITGLEPGDPVELRVTSLK